MQGGIRDQHRDLACGPINTCASLHTWRLVLHHANYGVIVPAGKSNSESKQLTGILLLPAIA
jgi:hypothetical protein